MARIVTDPAQKPANRPEAVAPPPARRAPGRGLGCYVLLFLCLLQFGLITGWVASHYAPLPFLAEAHQTSESTEPRKEESDTPPPSSEDPPSVQRGDEFMVEGRYDLALKVYEPIAATASGSLRDALKYRVALCQDGLGQSEQALQAYSIVAQSENPRTRAAAQVGQAWVLIRQRKPAGAKDLLTALVLRSGAPELRDQPYIGDARYLLALLMALDVPWPKKPTPLLETFAEYTAGNRRVESALSWVGTPSEARPDKGEAPKKSEETAADKEANYVGAERTGSAPDSMRVSADVTHGSVASLIERLAERAKLKVEWTDAAKKAAGERSKSLAWKELPVGDVLIDLILPLSDPLGLVATIKDGKLRLATEAETPADVVKTYRLATAKRALARAVASAPDPRNPLRAPAYLELGNLEARVENWKEAANHYEHLLQEFRISPLVVEASYNLGLVRLRQGQTSEARTAFYGARDQNPAHEMAPLALLQVGRTFLLEGDADQAIDPLKKGLAASTGTPPTEPGSSGTTKEVPLTGLAATAGKAAEPAAALALAAAYLMIDKPKDAMRAVREHPDTVSQPPYRVTAVFLDAYAQFLPVKNKTSVREASELLAALWAVEQKDAVLGPVATLLIGRAYRDLDQPEEMIAVYQKALPGIRTPIAAEMSYYVAEDLYQHNKREAARKLFLPLAADEAGRWTAEAQLRLAEIALLEDRPQEALQACRKLLIEKRTVKRETVLLLMGHAYERAGEPLKAAHCFEGKVPE